MLLYGSDLFSDTLLTSFDQNLVLFTGLYTWLDIPSKTTSLFTWKHMWDLTNSVQVGLDYYTSIDLNTYITRCYNRSEKETNSRI